MRAHDMKHLKQLLPVALGDVQHLRMKEATYQGSWKRSGGRSAWFMLRRKIDRLLEMMKRPEAPVGFDPADYFDKELNRQEVSFLLNSYSAENIFAMIRKDPSGSDGSVLAEVRDLRRYLLLVEAEMVSRGAIEEPVPEDGSSDDLYSSVAHATGIDRKDVKVVLRAAVAYSSQVEFSAKTGRPHEKEELPLSGARTVPRYDDGGLAAEATAPGAVTARGFSRCTSFVERQAFAGLEPWLVLRSTFNGAVETEQDRAALERLYDEHGAGLMKLTPSMSEAERFSLEMIVNSNTSPASKLIGSALRCYLVVPSEKRHVLDVGRAPRDYRSAWPVLNKEYNDKELSLIEPWQHILYFWVPDEVKYRIRSGWEAWTERE